MDFNYLMSKTCIRDLKCSLCENYLSLFPIYLTTTEQNICGRCKLPLEENVIHTRNKIYEMLAEDVKFPCRYVNEGCVEKLLPKQVQQHEKECPSRMVKCPASEFDLCQEEVLYPDLANHCREEHSDVIMMNGEFTIDLTKSEDTTHILINNNNFFIFKKKFNSSDKTIKFELSCFESEKINFADFYMLCLNSVFKSFTIENVICRDPDTNTFCLDFLKVPHCDLINGKLMLGTNSKANSKPETLKSSLNKGILEILKCTTCKKYIQPTNEGFYLGHNKTKCTNCATTTGAYTYNLIEDDRLVKLAAETIIYSCRFYKAGCTYTAQASVLKKHTSTCPYEKNECPLKTIESCTWKGLRKDTTTHITRNHYRKIARSWEFCNRLSNSTNINTHLLKFSKYYFRLSFIKKDQSFCWTVQMVGEFQDGFKYELKIYKDKKADEKFSVVKPCGPVISEEYLFRDVTQYCYFELNQIESLFHEGLLKFSIRIFKS